MQIEPTPLPGVLRITPARFGDARGFFSESWNRARLRAAGLDLPEFVQDNHSFSRTAGTVRGLHCQAPPHAQGKLVRCGRGRIFDVAVDIRRGSPTYGQWHGEELSFENGRQLWVPEGFLHGFMTLEENCEIIYKCTECYSPESEHSVLWNSLGIEWPLQGINPILSSKDQIAMPMKDFTSPFTFDIRNEVYSPIKDQPAP